MDDLIATLIRNAWHWANKKCHMKLYKWRGKKNSSFVDYAIALAYECEYEAHFKRNSHGQGEVVLEMEDGSVYVGSNNKGTYDIALLNAYHAEPYQERAVRAVYDELSRNDDGILYSIVDNGEQGLFFNIVTEIEANPKEKGAEYYISGYVENIFKDKRTKIAQTFHKYVKLFPGSEYDSLNNK